MRAKSLLLYVFALAAVSASCAANDLKPGDANKALEPSPTVVSQLCKIDMKRDKKDQWIRLPKVERSVTRHSINVNGRRLDYTAIAGTLIVRDDDDKPMASLSYVAYTLDGEKVRRPITFAFNGGPGASSVWLHMGVLGPRRVVVSDPDPTPPAPYRLVDNEYGLLDKSDLVMIDPVGTGLGHALCDHHDDEFWGVDPDIDSVSRFIAQYMSDNNRWTSPKYLLGESYGTTRAAAIVNYLRERRSLNFNGLILVSVATDIEGISADMPGNERPYAVYLPAYAAVAWYHKMLPSEPPSLEPFLADVRAYAMGPYMQALAKGDRLSDAESQAVAEKLHEYTGLPIEYLRDARLRVSEVAFQHELLRSRHLTVGRLDGRFTGPTSDPLAKDADYDPQPSAINAAYTASFLDYYHGDLNFGQGSTYRVLDFGIEDKWKWTHKTSLGNQPVVNSGVDLAEALMKDAGLKVLVLCGYFDLATPFSAAEYFMSHLGVPPSVGARVRLTYYPAGHMMYVNAESIGKMKKAINAFLDATSRQSP